MTLVMQPPAVRYFESVARPRSFSSDHILAALKPYRGRYAAVQSGWTPKSGYLYTVTRAISARINQNFDAWPSDELKKAFKTFLGKPVFVNHANFDHTKARGKIVAARYIDAGKDKYIEVIQEVDAQRFPKLAHEIRTGGLDSVSMGVEAGFTICSVCKNRATDTHNMCDHVLNHKGEHIMYAGRRQQVFEWCHKLGFFELSYVFDPADETAVVSRVMTAAKDDYPSNQNSQKTQIKQTLPTYVKAHAYFDEAGAPKGRALDYGAGLGHSSRFGDTFEPNPREGFHPTHAFSNDIPDGHYHRLTNLNVLNVVDPETRHHIVSEIGRVMAPGGHALVTTRGSDVMGTKGRPGPEPMSIINGEGKDSWYQKGFTRKELVGYLKDRLGDGYDVKPVGLGAAGAHIIRKSTTKKSGHVTLSAIERRINLLAGDGGMMDQAWDRENRARDQDRGSRPHAAPSPDRTPAPHVRDEDWVSLPGGGRALNPTRKQLEGRINRLAFGEIEAPEEVDTLRNENSDSDQDDTEQFQGGDTIPELRAPNIDQTKMLDRDQEQQGLDQDRNVEDVPDVPMSPQGVGTQSQEAMAMAKRSQRSARPTAARRRYAEDDGGGFPPGGPGDDFHDEDPRDEPHGGGEDDFEDDGYGDEDDGDDEYDGHDDDDFDDEGEGDEDGGDFHDEGGDDFDDQGGHDEGGVPPWVEEAAEEAPRGHEGRRRAGLGNRRAASRRQHFSAGEDGYTDGGPYGEANQGVKEDTYISETPPAEALDAPGDDGSTVHNTDSNLVARRLYQSIENRRNQMNREINAYNKLVRGARRYAEQGGVGTCDPDQVNPDLRDQGANDLRGDDFTDVGLQDGDVHPKDASVHAFAAFDRWLRDTTGRTARQHGNATFIRRCATRYCQASGITPDALFPALGAVLRQARTQRRADTDDNIGAADPNGRVDVEAPVSNNNTEDKDGQASQYSLRDFGQNAGDDIAKPDESTDTQIWAPGEGKKTRGPQSEASRKADAVAAVRYAEACIRAGIASSSDKWKVIATAQTKSQREITSHTKLLERVIQAGTTQRRTAQMRNRTAGSVPPGFTRGRVAATRRTAEHDPANDVGLFI